ncbi:MAG: CHAD domain-containing protein, partial [Novosphingobium sp.]|nr:CHAD domain-containing protein [Novosphingobium sp.]
ILGNLELQPLAETRIARTTRRLHHGQSRIEAAFDQGEIVAGDRSEPVCEIELELLSGQFPDLAALALELPLGPELRWSVAAKGERGHALAYGIAPKPVHPRPVVLSPAQDVGSAFRAIGWNCLEQLLANYPLVLGHADPEAIHQARVAIRRLRAAMVLFRKVVRDKQTPVLRAELKAAAARLGAVRDLDVLLQRIAPAAAPDDADAAELLAHLRARRETALHKAQTMLAGEQFQRVLMQVALWLEAGKWLQRLDASGGGGPLEPFVAKVLRRRRSKLRRMSRHLARIDDRARHKVRIEAKKLRYGVAFFASLYDSAQTDEIRRFAKALSRIQDRLGTLNDMVTAEAHRAALFAGLDPITAARLDAKLVQLDEAAGPGRARLLKSARKALARVGKAAAWWKGGGEEG